MATFLESTSQGFPSNGNPSPFPSFGNVGASYMMTLSLPRLTIGLPIWLFSTSVIPSVPTPTPPSPSFESHHVDSKVDLFPSSLVSSSSSSTLLGESLKSNNLEAKKMKKKKLDKREANRVVVTPNAPPVDKPSDPPWKVRFPCKLCKDDHLLRDCPSIPRFLEVWSEDLNRPCPSTSGDHVDVTPSTNDDKKKGKIRFPCRLCEGDHLLHLCPLMDKAFNVLENLTAPQPQLPISYQRLSSDPLPVGKQIDLNSPLVYPNLLEHDSLCMFMTNHCSKRVSTWLRLQRFTLFPKRVVIILLMFFSSPHILMN